MKLEQIFYSVVIIAMLYGFSEVISELTRRPVPAHTLKVQTSPESNLPFYVGSELVGTSPVSITIQEGTYQISVVLPTDGSIVFDHWVDETGATVSMPITLVTDKSLTAMLIIRMPAAYHCPYCGLPFDTIDEANEHILAAHPGQPLLMDIVWS